MATTQIDALNTALTNLTDTEHQVWVSTPSGGLYAYRTEVHYPAAKRWAEAWNTKTPDDVPEGSTFLVIVATTTFRVV